MGWSFRSSNPKDSGLLLDSLGGVWYNDMFKKNWVLIQYFLMSILSLFWKATLSLNVVELGLTTKFISYGPNYLGQFVVWLDSGHGKFLNAPICFPRVWNEIWDICRIDWVVCFYQTGVISQFIFICFKDHLEWNF